MGPEEQTANGHRNNYFTGSEVLKDKEICLHIKNSWVYSSDPGPHVTVDSNSVRIQGCQHFVAQVFLHILLAKGNISNPPYPSSIFPSKCYSENNLFLQTPEITCIHMHIHMHTRLRMCRRAQAHTHPPHTLSFLMPTVL